MKDESVQIQGLTESSAGAEIPAPATLATMRRILAKRFGIDDPALGEDRELASLGLDSLAFIEYAFELENEFHIVLPDLPRDMVTVGDLARFVEGELRRQAKVAAGE